MSNKPQNNLIYLIIGLILFAACCYPDIHYKLFNKKAEFSQRRYKAMVEEELPDMIREYDADVSYVDVNVSNTVEYGVKIYNIDSLFDEYTSVVNVYISLPDAEDDEYMCDRYAEYYEDIRGMINDIAERKCEGMYSQKDASGGINDRIWSLDRYIKITMHTDRHCLTSENKYNYVVPHKISDLNTGRWYEQDFDKSRGSKWINDLTATANYRMKQIDSILEERKRKAEEEKAKAENKKKNYNTYPRTDTSKSKNKSGYGGNSYDEGYDSIYDDGDYDDGRYDVDEDYALGVDDAMDELGEWW